MISRGASLVAELAKNPAAVQETWVQSMDWEDPLEREMATHSKFHEQRNLAGYGLWGCRSQT